MFRSRIWRPPPPISSGPSSARGQDFAVHKVSMGEWLFAPTVLRPRLLPGWAGPTREICAGMLILMKHTGVAKRLYEKARPPTAAGAWHYQAATSGSSWPQGSKRDMRAFRLQGLPLFVVMFVTTPEAVIGRYGVLSCRLEISVYRVHLRLKGG